MKCPGKKCEVIGTLVLCCGIWNDTATLENSLTIFPKFDMKLMHNEAILVLDITVNKLRYMSMKILYRNVYRSIIGNIWIVETI